MWSDKATWNGTEPGWGGYNNGSYDLPVDGDNVKIPEGTELLKNKLIVKIALIKCGLLMFSCYAT